MQRDVYEGSTYTPDLSIGNAKTDTRFGQNDQKEERPAFDN